MVGLNGVVTLIDMGFSGSIFRKNNANLEPRGTWHPSKRRAHDKAPVDMFAVGVTLYIMVFREMLLKED